MPYLYLVPHLYCALCSEWKNKTQCAAYSWYLVENVWGLEFNYIHAGRSTTCCFLKEIILIRAHDAVVKYSVNTLIIWPVLRQNMYTITSLNLVCLLYQDYWMTQKRIHKVHEYAYRINWNCKKHLTPMCDSEHPEFNLKWHSWLVITYNIQSIGSHSYFYLFQSAPVI
jgi:hypothetical protein